MPPSLASLGVMALTSLCLWQMLGDEIGKGAYGRVYKGLDLENGDFVAIKQVSLENIPPEDLASIMVSTYLNYGKLYFSSMLAGLVEAVHCCTWFHELELDYLLGYSWVGLIRIHVRSEVIATFSFFLTFCFLVGLLGYCLD